MNTRTRLSRREMLAAAGVIAGGAVVASCVPAAGPAAGTPKLGASGKPLVVATTGGSFRDWQTECFSDPFTKETGVSVAVDVAGPVAIMAAMLTAKKANQAPRHHVSKIDQFDIDFVEEQGLAAKIDKNIVTNWGKNHPSARTDYWLAINLANWIVGYNHNRVKKDITSWFDMWDDSFKGKTAIPTFEWVGYNYLVAINQALGGTPENVEPGFKKLKELVDTLQPRFMTGVEQGDQLLESGEVWFAPFYPDGRVRLLQDKKVAISMAFPKEGAVPGGAGFVINRGLEDNEREANVYLNKLADPVAQVCFATHTTYPPANTDAVLPAGLKHIKVSKEDLDRMPTIRWAKYEVHKGEYLARWNREIAKGG